MPLVHGVFAPPQRKSYDALSFCHRAVSIKSRFCKLQIYVRACERTAELYVACGLVCRRRESNGFINESCASLLGFVSKRSLTCTWGEVLMQFVVKDFIFTRGEKIGPLKSVCLKWYREPPDAFWWYWVQSPWTKFHRKRFFFKPVKSIADIVHVR